MQAFLAAYSRCGQVGLAAQAAGIENCTHYRAMVRDPEYRAAFAEARAELVDALESEAMRRVLEVRGEAGIGSDAMLVAMLKALKRDVYGDRVIHDGTVEIEVKQIELDRPSIHEEPLPCLEA